MLCNNFVSISLEQCFPAPADRIQDLSKQHKASLHSPRLQSDHQRQELHRHSFVCANIKKLSFLHTYKCTKVFSPRKAFGEIDLIWLFSMNLEKMKLHERMRR